MNKFIVLACLISLSWCQMLAQPAITNIDPVSTYPGSRVVISGSGFGTNTANLVVWFGSAAANITSASDNLLEVTVPAGASADNITVIDLVSGLTVQSTEKFFPVYSGSAFDPTSVEAPDIFSDVNQPYDPCTCDLDGDGKPEVVTTEFKNGSDVLIFQNQSTSETLSFTQTTVNVGQPTVNIRCGDLNGDGKPDLYMSRGGTTRFNVFVLENTTTTVGTITFGTLQTLPMDTDVISRRVAHKDLNGDGKPEILVTNTAAPEVIIFENTSSGSVTFNNTPTVIDVAGASKTSGLDVQDMDNDGKPDIVVCQFFGDDVFVLRNTGTGSISFAAAHVLTLTGNSLLNLTTGDFDKNGLQDIAVVGNSSDRVYIFLNNSTSGSFGFAAPQSFTANDAPWGISTGDVDGDDLLDIVVTSVNQDQLAVLNNQSSGGTLAFTKKDISLARRSRNVSVADLDGDAKPDFAITTQDAADTDYDVRFIRNLNCYEPQILNEEPLAICGGQTLTLEVPYSPSATFSWDKDGTATGSNSNTLDITTFGTYTLTATSEGGSCVTTASINVADGSGTVPGDPVINDPGAACIGGTLTLSISNPVSGATYSWSGPNNFSSTLESPQVTNVTRDNAGIYSVVIQSGDCQSSESEIAVEVVDMPGFSASASGVTEVCEGTTVSLSTQSEAGYSYQWELDGTPVSGATSSGYTASQSGNYTVVVTQDVSGCEVVTNAIPVGIYSTPVADFSIGSVACTGQTIAFTDNSTVDNTATAVYSWDFGDGNTSATQNPNHTYAAAATYDVQLAVSYSGVTGCTDSQISSVTVNDPVSPVIDASSTEICPGEEVTLSLTGTFNSVLWNTSETTNSIIVNAAGTYSVTVNDANGCDATSDITIASGTVPDVQATADRTSISEGDQVQLAATGADAYVWTPDTGLSDPNIANPIASPEATTTYIVTGTLIDGCSATAEITIIVSAGGEVNITPLKAFSPNSTINPTWTIENIQNYPDCTMSIFDERGALVFRQKDYSANEWNATYEGNQLPEGVYYYVFSCEDLKPKTGTVLVVR